LALVRVMTNTVFCSEKKLVASAAKDRVNLETASESTIIVAARGKSHLTIVADSDGGEYLRKAVKTLQEYLGKISGAQFSVVDDTEQQLAKEGGKIFIGPIGPAAKMELDLRRNVGGYIIKTIGNDIVITGREEDGTVNGIHFFLQKHLGVRWFMPGELFEVVPKRRLLVIKGGIDEKVEPDFFYKGFSGVLGAVSKTWKLRMGQGGHYVYAFHHNMSNILPYSKYGNKPEYYALVDGKRTVPRSDKDKWWEPCTSYPGTIKASVEAARAHFDANPRYDAFSVGQNDRPDFCECADCRKLDVEGRDFRRVKYTDSPLTHIVSNRYFTFVNEVARQVATTHPGKLIGTLAYLWTELPPIEQKMESNVVIFMTQDDSQHFDKAYRDLDRRLVDDWSKKINHFGVYVYYAYGHNAPRYYPHMAAEYLKYVHSKGARGYYCEAYPYWPYSGPKLYLISKLLWDINADPDEILDEFFDKLYGPSAEDVKMFYTYLEKVWMRPRPAVFFFESIREKDLKRKLDMFSVETVNKLLFHLNSAKEKAYEAGDPLMIKRIQYLEKGYWAFFHMAEINHKINNLEKIKIRSVGTARKALRAASELKKIKVFDESNPNPVNNYNLTIPRYMSEDDLSSALKKLITKVVEDKEKVANKFLKK